MSERKTELGAYPISPVDMGKIAGFFGREIFGLDVEGEAALSLFERPDFARAESKARDDRFEIEEFFGLVETDGGTQ